MKQKTLATLLAVVFLTFGGAAFAWDDEGGDDPELCRLTAEARQCILSVNGARDQCVSQANGDPDLIWLCDLDWREGMQVCDAIPPRCEINIP